MSETETLGRCSLFACFKESDLERIVPLCNRWDVEDGAVLFRQGQLAKSLYVVERGRAALDLSVPRQDSSGYSDSANVAILGPGEAFGWSAVMEPHIMTLSARAIGPGSFILIDGSALKEMLQRHKELGCLFMTALAQLLADRLIQTREALIYERGIALRV
ncbi:MAG: cyclic nucleotide-binding domain-containing protein [Chloroflexi bacterium]|nr:cyclic nucleotide-binding domain-containing protein [Chloroflexota bacterium]